MCIKEIDFHINYREVIYMKMQWKKLFVCIAIPLAVGGISAVISRGGISAFENVIKPPLTPPAWLFPLCWTILYVLMGVASYLVAVSDEILRGNALLCYGVQLILNFVWPLIFFDLSLYLLAFVWLVMLLALIILTIFSYSKIRRTAAYLQIPYALWVTFAGYLNLAIWLLNR